MHTIQCCLRSCRDEIKGVAILWVVFFHAQLGLSGFWYDVQKIGYGGVDIFFFLSGFGLYHSLSRDTDLGRYFMRRAARLLPAYWPFCLVWLAVMIPLSGMGIASAVRTTAGNLLMTAFFSDAPLQINWYVSALAASLIAAPILYTCLRDGKGYWKRAGWLMMSVFVLGLAFVDHKLYMAVSRLPVMILGMIFARPFGKQHRGVTASLAVAALAGLAVLMICFERFPEMLGTYALYWHPFVLITPGLCAGIGWLFARLPGVVRAPFRVLGAASFEIFLFNVWLEVLGKSYGLADTPLSWALWSVGSIAAGLLYHEAVTAFLKKVKKGA